MTEFDDDNEGNRIQGATARSAVEYVVRELVEDPDQVAVDVDETDRGEVLLTVHSSMRDKGKIIGRRGRTASAIRTVARAIGSREGANTKVDIPDD